MWNVLGIRHCCLLAQNTVDMVATIIGGFNNRIVGMQNSSTQLILVWDPKNIPYVIFWHRPLSEKSFDLENSTFPGIP